MTADVPPGSGNDAGQASAGRESCGCPAGNDMVYHQRGTCTDPVVAKLGWYADGQPADVQGQASAGQSARDALKVYLTATITAGRDHSGKCAQCLNSVADVMDLADAYVFARSRQEQPVPELAAAPELREAMAETRHLRDLLDDFTHAVIDLRQSVKLADAATAIRKKAGLPPVEDQ